MLNKRFYSQFANTVKAKIEGKQVLFWKRDERWVIKAYISSVAHLSLSVLLKGAKFLLQWKLIPENPTQRKDYSGINIRDPTHTCWFTDASIV